MTQGVAPVPPLSEPAVSTNRPWLRMWRGWSCMALFLVTPLGWFVRGRFIRRLESERLEQGLVLILPGVEGRSFLNLAILQGLLDADIPYALDIVDWTTGNKLLVLYHLRGWQRNQRQARELAQRIAEYRSDFPDRPVWIVGHSGGGAMALLTAAALPDDVRITGLILLAAAVSPEFDLTPAQAKVERGIWNFWSYLDCLFVGLGTTVFGTVDGCHRSAAGMVGFRSPPAVESPPVTQIPYRLSFIHRFNLGGHFGCVHRVFIAETIAPIVWEHGNAELRE